ncbi:unnamed protein product, partial [Symbiodinium pilosum]
SRRRSVLNTAAVIQDLESSEEYEYARLFRILLEIERNGDAELCVRNFLAENCEVTDLILDALPFLQEVEAGQIILPTTDAEMRQNPTFREFLQAMREKCISNATLLRIFTKLSPHRSAASKDACRLEAKRFCLDHFDANLQQSDWEQILQEAFAGAGDELTLQQWMKGCRWAARAARLIMTLRLA